MTKRFFVIDRERVAKWTRHRNYPLVIPDYRPGESIFPIWMSTKEIVRHLFSKYRPVLKLPDFDYLCGVYTLVEDAMQDTFMYATLTDIRIEWDTRVTRYNSISQQWDAKYNNQGRVVAQQSTAF